jgi:mRNA interferase RelE/StbE
MKKRKTQKDHVKTIDFGDARRDTDTVASVFLTPTAAEQLDRLPKAIHARVNRLLERLRNWPTVGAKSLSGNLAGWFRLRTGDYRLCFRVQGSVVIVDKIGHRSDFYDE